MLYQIELNKYNIRSGVRLKILRGTTKAIRCVYQPLQLRQFSLWGQNIKRGGDMEKNSGNRDSKRESGPDINAM